MNLKEIIGDGYFRNKNIKCQKVKHSLSYMDANFIIDREPLYADWYNKTEKKLVEVFGKQSKPKGN